MMMKTSVKVVEDTFVVEQLNAVRRDVERARDAADDYTRDTWLASAESHLGAVRAHLQMFRIASHAECA